MTGRMNYSRVARGSPMRAHRIAWKIKPTLQGGPQGSRALSTSDIPQIRKLLRTDMPAEQIAHDLGVSYTTLKTFIRQRGICNLKARRDFIALQASLAKLPEPTA